MFGSRRLASRVLPVGLSALVLTIAACSGSSNDAAASPTLSAASATEAALVTAEANTTDEATATATEEPGATSVPPEVCEPTTAPLLAGAATLVTVNNECLNPLFFAFDQNGGDPFWHIHTQQDNTFISLELYTAYGPSWTGETGTFPLDCNVPWGLCLLWDPDGTGPEPVLMWGTGEITINRLDEGGYDVTFQGTMPPTANGIVYQFTSTTWSGS